MVFIFLAYFTLYNEWAPVSSTKKKKKMNWEYHFRPCRCQKDKIILWALYTHKFDDLCEMDQFLGNNILSKLSQVEILNHSEVKWTSLSRVQFFTTPWT